MIGKQLGDGGARRALLRDSIGALRDVWDGVSTNSTRDVGFDQLAGVVDTAEMPPLIIGASAWSTIEVAIDVADGVNIRRTAALSEQLRRLAELDLPDRFEVSVLDMRADGDGLGIIPDDLVSTVVDRYIVTVWPARDLDLVAGLPPR